MAHRAGVVVLALVLTVPAFALAFPVGDPPAPAAAAALDAGPAHSSWNTTFTSFDGVKIAITVFRPEGATAESPVPVVVRSHGWAGSREKSIAGFPRKLLDAGYGVVTFDARGHGDSEGVARVHDPDFEIRDVSLLFDWMFDNLPWALREEGSTVAKDLVLGSSGGSYGGGWQLLSAGLDERLDALAPEITWNSLPQSLAPNGAVSSDWVHALYAGGKARARLHPDIDRWYAEVMITNGVPAEAYAHFVGSSVFSYSAAIDVPTLLVQGVPDTLFNLNQAVANFEQISANGAETVLWTHLGGHLVATGFFAGFSPVQPPFAVPDLGVPQPADRGSPCGGKDATIVAWYDRHLKGLAVPAPPPVSIAMDDLTCETATSLPTAGWTKSFGAPVALPANAGSLVLPVLTADAPVRIAGIPRLTAATAAVAGPDDILYASLYVVPAEGTPRTGSSQVTPVRLHGPAITGFEVDLGGVGVALAPGDALFLKLDRANEFYATNSGRLPSAIVLDGVALALPVLE